MINFEKRKQIYQVIIDLLKFQEFPYNFQYVHQISILLKNFKLLEDKELYEKSLI